MKNEDKKVPDAPKRLWVKSRLPTFGVKDYRTSVPMTALRKESTVVTWFGIIIAIHTMPLTIANVRNGGTELLSKHTRCLAASSTSTGTAILSFSFTISN